MDESPEAQLILASLVHTGDGGQSILSSGTVDYTKLFMIADRNLVTYALSSQLRALRLPPDFPSKVLEKFKFRNELLHDILVEQALSCTSLLEENGIPVLVLKGLSIPARLPRDIGDLDLLIPETRLLDAVEILRAKEYAYVGDILNRKVRDGERGDLLGQLSWNSEFLFRHPKTGLLIEIHTNLFPKARTYPHFLSVYLDSISEIWNRKRRCGQYGFDCLSTEDLFLLMSVHGSVKRSPGNNRFALRTILDLHDLISQGIDWELVEGLSQRYAIAEHVFLAVNQILVYFPDAVPVTLRSRLRDTIPPRLSWITQLHFSSFNGIEKSRSIPAYLYRVLVPLFYKGSLRSRLQFSVKALVYPLRRLLAPFPRKRAQ